MPPADLSLAAGTQARGRRGNDGQEQVPDPKLVEPLMDKLLKLYQAKVDAAEALSESIKKAAEKSGFNAGAIKRFVKARAEDDDDAFAGKRREAEQLVLLFEKVGN